MNNNHTIVSNFEEKEKKKSRGYVDTSNYRNIIYNKTEKSIKLFNQLDKRILNIGKDITRNYLVKTVAYRLKTKIVDVEVKQSNILVMLHKDIKVFDDENRLFIKKGYEKQLLCYYMIVDNIESLNYVINICNKLYLHLKDDPVEELFIKLSKRINDISNEINSNILKKGIAFKSKKNFLFVEKKQYGLYIKLLNVKDENNILENVGKTSYDPLCKCYKLCEENEIDKIIPFIKESFDLSKYNSLDLKNNLIEMYYSE